MLGGVRIKLVRWGFRNNPFYVFSVMDKRRARNTGTKYEDLGWWDPTPAGDGNQHMGLKIDRIKYWLAAGASPTPTMTRILGRLGILPEQPTPPRNSQTKELDEKWLTKWKAKKGGDS